jgi:integrase
MALRKRGPWWHYRYKVNGKEYAGSTELPATEANRKAAERYEQRERAAQKAGQRHDETLDFATAAGQFIRWCQDVEYRQKANTAARIRTSLSSAVSFFGHREVQQLDSGAVEGYKTHRFQVNLVKDITVRHDLHALSLFFRYARKMHWCEHNPLEGVKIPSDRDAVRINPISQETERQYFKFASRNRNLHDVAKLILNQGCRPEEIMASAKLDLDVKGSVLKIRGGKSRAAKRDLHLTPESLKILTARLKTPGIWLFPSTRRAGYHITKLSNAHDKACREAGVSFVLYDLRHTFGTRHGTEYKTDPFTLAAMMGHANLRTISRYVHPDTSTQRAAMERYAAAQQMKLRRVK